MRFIDADNPIINSAQREMDAQARQDAYEEERIDQLWDELDAALHAGILSAESYNLIRNAMDEDMKP